MTSPQNDAVVALKATVGADGKQREMVCLAYTDFMIWLAHITPSRVKSEARQAVIATRNEIKLLIGNFYHQRIFGQALSYGWDFETLRRNSSASSPRLVAVIKECFNEAPKGTPFSTAVGQMEFALNG